MSLSEIQIYLSKIFDKWVLEMDPFQPYCPLFLKITYRADTAHKFYQLFDTSDDITIITEKITASCSVHPEGLEFYYSNNEMETIFVSDTPMAKQISQIILTLARDLQKQILYPS